MFYLMMCSAHFIYDYMVLDKVNLLPPLHGLLFLDQQQSIFYIHHASDRIAHKKPENWLEQEIIPWVYPGIRVRLTVHWPVTYTTDLHCRLARQSSLSEQTDESSTKWCFVHSNPLRTGERFCVATRHSCGPSQQ